MGCRRAGDTPHLPPEKPSEGQVSTGAGIWSPWLAGKCGGHRVWLQCGERPQGIVMLLNQPRGQLGGPSRGAWDRSGGRGQAAVIVQDWVATRRGDQGLQGG